MNIAFGFKGNSFLGGLALEISDNVKVQIDGGKISELLSKTSDQSNNSLQENKKGSFLSKLNK